MKVRGILVLLLIVAAGCTAEVQDGGEQLDKPDDTVSDLDDLDDDGLDEAFEELDLVEDS